MIGYNSIEEMPEERYLKTLLGQFDEEDGDFDEFEDEDEDEDDGLDFPADEE